jgi:hypothetical protein
MLDILEEVFDELPDIVRFPELWDSLIVNRRKPITYRAFHIFKEGSLAGIRVCLHRFEYCEAKDAFLHPHPWPSAMKVLSGQYKMNVGFSQDLVSQPTTVVETILARGSVYASDEPRFWHSVQPVTEHAYSVMINGPAWGPDIAHTKAPTTKGKDLDKMSQKDLEWHLHTFTQLISNHEHL